MKNILIFSAVTAITLSCANEPKSTHTPIKTNPKTEQLDTLYTELYKANAFNGNVLVAEHGEIIFTKSYGLANEATQTHLNTESIFELASVSKQFTAMGILLLQKEGLLSYDDPAVKYIPELKAYPNITIKHLLTHTGGLPDYMALANEHWNKSSIATNDDMLKLFETLTPQSDFNPNTKWEYSNTGYLILGSIIERISKLSFENYLSKKIFIPLGMKNTSVYRRRYQPEKMNNYAEGYLYSDSLNRKMLPDELGKDSYMVYLDGIVGDGMINSNVIDLLKWDQALYSNTLINTADKSLIFSSYTTRENKETDYGFGWMIDSTDTYGKIVSHSGGWAGYTTYIERDIDNNKTIIILQNNSTGKTEIPVKNTRRILYNQPVEKPITLDNNLLKRYAGTYLNEKQKEKYIVFEQDKLFIQMSSDFKMELVPVSQTKFIVDGFSPEVSFTFVLNANGKVEKYHIQQASQDVSSEAIRID